MLRVLQISNYLWPHIGGIEQVARCLIAVFRELPDTEQKVICFNEDASQPGADCKRGQTVTDIVDGVEVIRCGCFAKIASQSLSWSYHRELKQLLDDFRPQVIIFHYPNPFAASLLLPMLPTDTLLVLYWHLDITKQKILGKLFEKQTKALLERADYVLAATPNYIQGSQWLSRYKGKCQLLPYCINDSSVKADRLVEEKKEQFRKEYSGKVIVFAVGRHVPYKGLTYLIQASKALDERFLIVIGGEGELTGKLKKEAEGDKKVMFVGRLNRTELLAWYAACDIFAFPSITKNEAFGIALAEAMHFGKPAVTFTIPGSGVNYVSLNGVTGIECANKNSSEFAQALVRLAEDQSLRKSYGSNAAERVSRLFTEKEFQLNVGRLAEAWRKGRRDENHPIGIQPELR